jgi:hypothetical protein
MKLMTIICISKNILNKQFQHFVEKQLIEVMNAKMQVIQFFSILNLIQMKFMSKMHKIWSKQSEESELAKESKLDLGQTRIRDD